MADTFAYCLKHGILGVGWRVDEIEGTTDWDAFYTAAADIHDDLGNLRPDGGDLHQVSLESASRERDL